MNLYNKYILPTYLNWAMNTARRAPNRADVVGGAESTVLEVGFGSGLNIPFYKNITKLYALDTSSELVHIAQEKFRSVPFPIEYVVASAEKIPLPDNSVDCVVSTWSLCSIPDPARALAEIKRVLKPGGQFRFIEHGKSPSHFIAKLQNVLTPVSKTLAGGCHLNRDIEKLIRDVGFEMQQLEKIRSKGAPLGFTYKGIAIRN